MRHRILNTRRFFGVWHERSMEVWHESSMRLRMENAPLPG